MTALALVHGKELLDTLFVAAVGLLILFGFVWQERREQKRRRIRKEHQARYSARNPTRRPIRARLPVLQRATDRL